MPLSAGATVMLSPNRALCNASIELDAAIVLVSTVVAEFFFIVVEKVDAKLADGHSRWVADK